MNEVERILDANFNRATEGLRVIEDLIRFNPNHLSSCEPLKKLRHELFDLLKEESILLVGSRIGSVEKGRGIKGKTEYDRTDSIDLIRSNFKRAQEAIRVLEEVSKLSRPDAAEAFEKVRYKLYDLENELIVSNPFPKNCLYALVTKSLCKLDPLDVVKGIRDGGADVIQLREKGMEDGEFIKWAREVKKELEGSQVKLVINDRVHIASIIEAAGVHLGQGDFIIEDAKKILHPWQWVGRSTNCIEVAKEFERQGHTYIGVGPIYETQTKLHRKPVGLSYIKEVNEQCSIPYVAIGSVNRDSFDAVLSAQPKGIAICTGIIAQNDPKKETEFYKKAMLS